MLAVTASTVDWTSRTEIPGTGVGYSGQTPSLLVKMQLLSAHRSDRKNQLETIFQVSRDCVDFANKTAHKNHKNHTFPYEAYHNTYSDMSPFIAANLK